MHGKASLDDPATDAGLGLPPTPIDIVQSDLDFLRYGISYLSLKTRVSRSGEIREHGSEEKSASTEPIREDTADDRRQIAFEQSGGACPLSRVRPLNRGRRANAASCRC